MVFAHNGSIADFPDAIFLRGDAPVCLSLSIPNRRSASDNPGCHLCPRSAFHIRHGCKPSASFRPLRWLYMTLAFNAREPFEIGKQRIFPLPK
jgi:hypothetical protein